MEIAAIIAVVVLVLLGYGMMSYILDHIKEVHDKVEEIQRTNPYQILQLQSGKHQLLVQDDLYAIQDLMQRMLDQQRTFMYPTSFEQFKTYLSIQPKPKQECEELELGIKSGAYQFNGVALANCLTAIQREECLALLNAYKVINGVI